jgi:ubiquinone/menaquinone biosynthesis C-methylase UbiE
LPPAGVLTVEGMSSDPDTYVLGHSESEVQRLLLQGRLHDDFTEHALRLAGLRPGMRVLDVGCGPGDVSFAAARIVGSTGTVLGVDTAADVIEFARARAAVQELASVRFVTTSIADMSLSEPVDAVVGRLILMHLPDPVDALRQLATKVSPGGLVAFCEADAATTRVVPGLPLWTALKDAVIGTFAGAGFDPEFGTKLHTIFRRAGLTPPRLTLGAPMGRADDAEIVNMVVETWRSLVPVAERLGLVADELADLETLPERLREQAADTEAIAVMPAMICASSRV